MVSNISVGKLKGLNNIIDLRSIQSYNNNHIPNAINIPYEKLLASPGKYLNYNETYYLYCYQGITSSKVCMILSSLGYRVINIAGGYEKWILEKED